jgi:thiosulfate dehydrogenase
MTLADRVNECFERSMNGKPLPPDSIKLTAIVMYIEWLSQNVSLSSAVPWQRIPRLASPHQPDPHNGKKVYERKCVFCHGVDGQGTMTAPPVWGLVRTTSVQEWRGSGVAASFIKANIPRGCGWTVTDGESFDAAAYINAQLRPDFPDKIHDRPKGGKPADILY